MTIPKAGRTGVASERRGDVNREQGVADKVEKVEQQPRGEYLFEIGGVTVGCLAGVGIGYYSFWRGDQADAGTAFVAALLLAVFAVAVFHITDWGHLKFVFSSEGIARETRRKRISAKWDDLVALKGYTLVFRDGTKIEVLQWAFPRVQEFAGEDFARVVAEQQES